MLTFSNYATTARLQSACQPSSYLCGLLPFKVIYLSPLHQSRNVQISVFFKVSRLSVGIWHTVKGDNKCHIWVHCNHLLQVLHYI
jgi:hypothetical protein